MSFDFLGQLLGPARRRELTGRMAVNVGLVTKRIGVGLTAASGAATLKPDLLTTHAGLGVLGLTFLAGVFSVGKGNTGLVNPTAPGKPSVIQAAVQGVSALLAAPAAKRQAVFQEQIVAGIQSQLPQILTLAAQEINKTNMTGFSASELGGAAPNDPAQATAAPTAPVAPETGTPDPTEDLKPALTLTAVTTVEDLIRHVPTDAVA